GRSAVREGRRESDQVVWPQQRRPRAKRYSRRGSPRAQACLQALLQVGAEPHAGARARRRRAASVSRDHGVSGVLRPQRPRVGGGMTIRVGVVGAGALGFHHTRILRDVPGATLVGFYDSDSARASTVASELGVKAFASLEALLDQAQAVTIAVPTP